MNILDREELSAYRELAEHLGVILAKRWTETGRIASTEVGQTIAGNKSKHATKGKSKKGFMDSEQVDLA